MTNKRILISNDDGVGAPGLSYLVEHARRFGHVTVVAPSGPRSGQSAAITVDTPLTITRHDDLSDDGVDVFSVNGTPVDCVKLAHHTILTEPVDLMVCGVNHGTNAGNCVLYSGTMGAVQEAAMLGLPAIGFSLLHHSLKADFSQCGESIDRVMEAVLKGGLPPMTCLNVNIPARCTPRGIKTVRAARGCWTDEYQEYMTPYGTPFYWLSGRFVNAEPDADDTDEYWLAREWTTVVPVTIDSSATKAIETIKSLLDND